MTGKRAIIAAGAIAVLLLSGCARGADTADGPTSTGSAAPADTAAPSPTTPSAVPSVTGCTTGDRQVTVTLAEPPGPVCIHAGNTLILRTSPSPKQKWQAFASSAPETLTCTSTLAADGSATATCHALRAGEATLSATTAAFSPDPHGPAQGAWQLAVQVRA